MVRKIITGNIRATIATNVGIIFTCSACELDNNFLQKSAGDENYG
jgi:hypothetical protein